MKMTYSRIILYSFLLFGTGILCDGKLERLEPESYTYCSVKTDDKFNCSNGQCIEWPLVCDGHKHCLDGSDETDELCAIYKFGTNMTMDCGRVNKKYQVISEEGNQSLVKLAPWTVGVFHRLPSTYKLRLFCYGSIIAPNIVISVAKPFRYFGIKSKQTPINDGKYNIADLPSTKKIIRQNLVYLGINVIMIYLNEDPTERFKFADLSVLVLENKVSFGNSFAPVCIDWYSKYDMKNEAQLKIVGIEEGHDDQTINFKAIQGFFPYIDNSTCLNKFDYQFFQDLVTYDKICIRLPIEGDFEYRLSGAGLSFVHSNSYFLTGVIPMDSRSFDIKRNNKLLGLTDIKYYVPWIRGILNKHVTMHACVLPIAEGVIYTYKDSHTILSHGTLINQDFNITENCEVGYHKAYLYSYRICQGRGKWFSSSGKLCFKNMCPPLLSESLDIKCTINEEYANCSNLSKPNTIATTSCKTSYTSTNEQEEERQELLCQSNGMWNKQLYSCNQSNSCILPTVEGVIYTYQNFNESLSHGTLINHHQIVIESCELGYHKAYPKSYIVCLRSGKWEMAYDKLCLKKCPPLLSDSLDIKCTLNGEYANCSNLSIPDTKARPSCKPTYALLNGQKETPLELHCRANGTWNNQLYICYPDCGKLYIKTQVLIENGKLAPVGTAPWNVAVYRLNKENSNYDMICGGSIISSKLIVSAAHCFWEKDMLSNKTLVNDGLYKIAVGKYDRNFSNIDNELTEIMNVDIVYLKERYHGVSGFYSDDIAVVVLQNNISFSNGVAPICIDWKGNYNVVNGTEGKIVGWGDTEKGIPSPILLEASLSYIDHSSCREMFKNGFGSYVTYDKFCAGSISASGQRVQRGDSGTGLCFLHSNSYYLTGIVSNKEAFTSNAIALFTEVKYHINWIRELYEKHN